VFGSCEQVEMNGCYRGVVSVLICVIRVL